MLLNYLCMRIGANHKSDLKYSDLWEDVLLAMCQDVELCRMFSIYDWQEALLWLKQEHLTSDNYADYLKRLLI